MKLFIIKYRHASAAALAVESRSQAFGEEKVAVVGAFDMEYAKAILADEVMRSCDDAVQFDSIRALRGETDPFVEIIS